MATKEEIDARLAWADYQSGGPPSISDDKPVDTVTPKPIRVKKPKPKSTTTPYAPSSKPDNVFVTGHDIRKEKLKTIYSGIQTARNIDSRAWYRLEGGKVTRGKNIQQDIISRARQSFIDTSKIQSGEYVEVDGQYYHVTGETRYLLAHAEPKERQKMIASFGKTGYEGLPDDFVGPIQPPIYPASRKAYGSLTPEEKETYGYTFTPFIDRPVEEWKYHPGGSKYLESVSEEQMKGHVTTFLKEHKVEHDPWYALGSTWRVNGRAVEGLRTKGLTDKEKRRKISREEITMTPSQIKEHYYNKLSPAWKSVYSTGHAFSSSVIWPVTLAQTGIKIFTKGKTVFPDIPKELTERQMGPSSKIETTIGKIFGTDVSEREKIQSKYPIATAFATGGNIFGMWLGGKTLGGGIGAAGKLGLKHTVKYTPKVVGKLKDFTGSRIWTLTPGKKPVPVSTFSTKIGKTKVWEHMHGWSTGKMEKVLKIPISKQTFYKGSRVGVTKDGFTLFGKSTTYKGWGKSEWLPKIVAKTKGQGEYISHTHKIIPDMYRGQPVAGTGQRLQIFEKAIIGRPKGFLWWKKVKTQSYSLRETERYGTNIQSFLKTDISSGDYGSWMRYPSLTGKTQSPINVLTEQYLESGSKMIVDKATKGWVTILRKMDETASASLVHPTMTYRPMMTGGMRGLGSLGGTKAVDYFGISSKAFWTFPKAATLTGLAIGSESISGLTSAQALDSMFSMEQVQQSAFDTGRMSRTKLESRSAVDFMDDTAFVQLLAQRQAYKYIQERVTVPVSLTKTTPVFKMPPAAVHAYGAHFKPVYFPKDDFIIKRKKAKRLPKEFGTGYRFRTWKTPSMKQFFEWGM